MLELHELHKRYGERVALDGVSLRLEAGEVLGLLGPNGAGKSTLCALAVGLLPADGGRVEIAGAGSPREPSARRALGFAPQSLAVYEQLTGAENLAFFAGLYGLKGARRDERVAWVLDFVGLADRAGDRVRSYSGGMARRLNLAAALIHEPRLLLLDEPTVGVDPQSRNLLLDNVAKLREQGVAVLYTTHYMEEAERLCDRVAIIDHGRILASGRTKELLAAHGGDAPTLVVELADEAAPRRIVDADPVAALRGLSDELAAAGRPAPRSFHVERPTLEGVFLELTGRSLRD
ncbi:MAG: ABC transporter ATP-binding protein [Myxococcales bacterium]|nr:ABC transporter ATP-binding protein [Myxococcales bacterium]